MDNISFHVERGEIVGLLGPNGAGKTTAINMVLGVLEPTSGTILVEDFNIETQRRRALDLTNFAAVYAPLPGNLTVEQNLRIYGLLYGVARSLRDALKRCFASTTWRNSAARNAACCLPVSRPA